MSPWEKCLEICWTATKDFNCQRRWWSERMKQEQSLLKRVDHPEEISAHYGDGVSNLLCFDNDKISIATRYQWSPLVMCLAFSLSLSCVYNVFHQPRRSAASIYHRNDRNRVFCLTRVWTLSLDQCQWHPIAEQLTRREWWSHGEEVLAGRENSLGKMFLWLIRASTSALVLFKMPFDRAAKKIVFR